ncbi:hypothetical protein QWY20_17520 [Alkalimonas sp. MEB108]|uniref:Uncharacterized protein n=1 Tax=Alkalimonas cellulosilytica TaxID=3058395 RepID=A0ABU7JAM9_9GAMM|nr:hypothetical protein [Alkalimonas sp. MEB108]MEE2003255.1 hypothetical protein [Alkalimonas sp. MEB108]
MRYFPVVLIIYLFLQIQSVVVLWSLQSRLTAFSDLEIYQMYGYAAVGLGVAVLVLRWQLKLFTGNNFLGYTCGVALGAVALLSTIVVMHKVVQTIPSLIPAEYRVKAYQSSLRILAEPSKESFWSFYQPTTAPADYSRYIQYLVNQLEPEQHELIDLYHKQLFNLQQFARLYHHGTDTFDEQKVRRLVANAYFSAQSELRGPDMYAPLSAATSLFYVTASPLKTRAVFQNGLRDATTKHSGTLTLLAPILMLENEKRYDGLPFIDAVLRHHQNFGHLDLAWQKLTAQLAFLEKSPHNKMNLLDSLRRAYSDEILQAKGLEGRYLMPFHQSGMPPLEQAEFIYLAERVAPLWMLGGAPQSRVRLLAQLAERDNEQVNRWVREFHRSQQSIDERHYNMVQYTVMHWLLESENLWRFKAYTQAYGDLIRLSTTLPMLLILALCGALLTAVALFKAGLLWVLVGVGSACISLLLAASPLSMALFKLLAWLSTGVVFES